jgi:hypothetical protein
MTTQLFLQDPSGILWTLSNDGAGNITLTKGVAGTAAPIYLNDNTQQTSWLLTVDLNGQLGTVQQTLNLSYPTSLSLSASFNLGITSTGRPRTLIVTAPQAQASGPVTRDTTVAPPNGQVIPLTPSPNQSFSTQLQVDGAALTLRLAIRWSAMAGYWVMSIFDAVGDLLLDSIPMVTGWYPGGNLLGQFGYLKIGSAYLLNQGNNASDYPGQTDLGTGFQLLWGDTAA